MTTISEFTERMARQQAGIAGNSDSEYSVRLILHYQDFARRVVDEYSRLIVHENRGYPLGSVSGEVDRCNENEGGQG